MIMINIKVISEKKLFLNLNTLKYIEVYMNVLSFQYLSCEKIQNIFYVVLTVSTFVF